jgi:thiol-disulfide isomerase/thioredoxin
MTKDFSKLSMLSVGALAIVLMGAGCAPTSAPVEDGAMEQAGDQNSEDTMMAGDKMNEDKNMVGGDAMEKDGDAMMESVDAMEKDADAMMESGDAMQKDGEAMMEQATAGTFSEYSEAALASADGSVVLAFFADWCSTCKAAKKDINAQLDEIPGGLSILDVDFDNSAELRKKYKVTTQHTYVQVDAAGNMIKSWRGGNTLESIVDKIS